MSSGLDWGFLVAHNQAKAYGVSWSDEELHAGFQLKIPADYVRNGILTLEDYQAAKQSVDMEEKETGKKPNVYQKKEELIKELVARGVPVSADATRGELLMLIEQMPNA